MSITLIHSNCSITTYPVDGRVVRVHAHNMFHMYLEAIIQLGENNVCLSILNYIEQSPVT